MTIKLPVIIVELSNGDVEVFETLAAIEGPLEPGDVFNGEYMGFDNQGRLLKLIAKDKSFRFPILIEAAEETPTHQYELRHYLTRWLSFDNSITDQELETASLDDLIQRCIDLQDEWESRPGCYPTVGRFLNRLMNG